MDHKKNFFRFIALLLLLPLAFSFIYPKRIRVAIVKDGKKVTISLPQSFEVKLEPYNKNLLNDIKQKRKITIKKQVVGYTVNGTTFLKLKKIVVKNNAPDKTRIKVNGKPYRGNVTIVFVDDLYVINDLPLEQYVYGVLPGEISPNWPMEAIKAQAVAARTYAVYVVNKRNTKDKYFDVDATTNFQVYKGSFYEAKRTNKAVDFTRGEIMLYKNEPIESYFHSICGGYTEDAEDVWGQNLPYLRSIRCDYCKISPNFYWKYKVKKKKLEELLDIGEIKAIKLKKDKRKLRVREMVFITNKGVFKIKPKKMRQIFGEYKFRSNIFDVNIIDGNVIFKGKGFGHGVGLCQWGAFGMAKKGRHYRDILRYYYHNISFRKFYEDGSF